MGGEPRGIINAIIHEMMGLGWYIPVSRSLDATIETRQYLSRMGWKLEWDPVHQQYLSCAPETHIELLRVVTTPLPEE